MGNNGITCPVPAHTDHGGDAMEPQTVKIGQVTYELRRTFQGTQTLMEVMADRLAQKIPDERSVDGGDGHAV